MYFTRRRWLRAAILVAIPIALLAVLLERRSWRPQILGRLHLARNGITFSPDGKTLALSVIDGKDRGIELWDVNKRARTRTLKTPDEIICATAFSPDGRLLVASTVSESRSLLSTWNLSTGDRRSRQAPEEPESKSYATPRYMRLTQRPATFTTYGEDYFREWDARSLKPLRSRPAPFDPGLFAAFSHDGRFAVVAAHYHKKEGYLRLYDLRTNGMRQIMHGAHDVRSLAISPDNTTLAIGTETATILLWKIDEPQPFREIKIPPAKYPANRNTINTKVALSYLATPSVFALAFSPDGSTLAGASNDGLVRLWRVR